MYDLHYTCLTDFARKLEDPEEHHEFVARQHARELTIPMSTPQPPYGTPAYHAWNAQQIVQGETHQRNLAGGYPAAAVSPWSRGLPKAKYVTRTTRAIVFGLLAYACFSMAISSYVNGHRTGYTPFSQISTTADPHPNPTPFVMVGAFFALLALLQLRKMVKAHKRRQEIRRQAASGQYQQGGPAGLAPQYGGPPQGNTRPGSGQVVYPQTGSTMPPTAPQNAAYNANGPAAQNAARNMYGNNQ